MSSSQGPRLPQTGLPDVPYLSNVDPPITWENTSPLHRSESPPTLPQIQIPPTMPAFARNRSALSVIHPDSDQSEDEFVPVRRTVSQMPSPQMPFPQMGPSSQYNFSYPSRSPFPDIERLDENDRPSHSNTPLQTPGNQILRQDTLGEVRSSVGAGSSELSSGPTPAERRSRPPPKQRKKRPASSKSQLEPDKQTEADTSTASTSTTGSDPPGESGDIGIEGIEDIANCITMSSEHPANVTGHFCDLFVGTHTIHGKVALKRPRIGHQDYTREDVRRFLREADTWRTLRHKYILNFIGTCRINGFLYMVSPYIEHGTLSGYVERNPDADRVRLLYETAEAIAYLHECGVIHGDIKATNVLVSDTIHALLCDFGLTKFASSSTSTALKSAGSTRWQSPELWDENQPKSYESDTYAFGMTIVEVLSGQVPFPNYEVPSVIKAVMIKNERPPPEPMFSPTGIPYYRTWRAAIRCWLQDPKKRPSMKSVAQILRLPITPPPRLNAAVQVRSENTSKPVPNVMENPAQGSGEELEEEPGSEKETEDNDEGEESEEITYCYCGGDSYGLMVDCCDERCDREWFHLPCLGMRSMPPQPWSCLKCESTRMTA